MADINVIVLPDGTEYSITDYYLPAVISNPTAGQVLKYDAENHVWYNGDDAEGSSVFYGTSAPTSQLGVDGNLYVKYTEGTGGASDTVDALYVKLDGAWCQISTGGGGTSDYNDLTNKPQINSVELSGNKSLDDLGIQPSEISKTATGSIVTFSDGGDNIPVESFECEIVAQQASGTPTPENPLPITGFNSADIPVSGINIWRYGDLSITTNQSLDVNIPAGTYNLSGEWITNSGYNCLVIFYDENNTEIVRSTFTPDIRDNKSYQFLTPCKRVVFYSGDNYTHSNNKTATISNIMLKLDSSVADYVPYTGNTYLFDWGINQWNEEWEVGSLSASGEEINNPAQFRNVGYIAATPNTTLFIKSSFTAGIQIYQFDSSKTYIRRDFVKDTTITLQSTCAYIRFRTPDTSPAVYGNDISINFPSTYTDYYKYVTGQTIYGGRLIYANGEWAIRATHEILSAFSSANYYSSTTNKFIVYLVDNAIGYDGDNKCSVYSKSNVNNLTNIPNLMYICRQNFVVFRDDTYDNDLSGFISFMSNKQFIYELETPLIIPLTSTAKIKTLSGVNNIFSNTGDSTVKYFTNDADGIEELINVSETSAENTAIDDTNLEYGADNVQEALEKITKSLTYAEYQALSEEEKNNGTIYFITDVNGGVANFSIIDVLWSGTAGSTETITLNSNYDNYDLIIFKGYNTNGTTYSSTAFSTNSLELNTNSLLVVDNSTAVTDRRVFARFTEKNKLTITTAESGSQLKEIIGIKLNGGVSDYHEYSTNERIVGKWIDGRTVYEKTMNVGAIGSGTTFAHGITNLDWIIDYSMFGLYAGSNKLVSPANGSSGSIGFVIASWDSTNITFTKGNLSSNFSNCYCTIRYIKTS